MTSNDVVVRVVEALERQGISYMLVGSYSSNAYGIARSTQDADFVLQADDRPMTPLFAALSPLLRFDPQMRLETVTMTSRWVGQDERTGFKVELFLVTGDPHDAERFARRHRQPFLGTTAFLPTAEDVVVQKLRWFHRGRRPKDRQDVVDVLSVQLGRLDLAYVRNWCDRHGSRGLLDQLLADVTAAVGPEVP